MADHEPAATLLRHAALLVTGDRADSYGPVWEDYGRTVATFNALTGHDLSTREALLFMVCVKLSREVHRHGTDNLTDAAGYLALIETLES